MGHKQLEGHIALVNVTAVSARRSKFGVIA